MSLLNPNRSYSAGDYLFIAVGLLGLFAFFMTYSSQDPRSIIDTSLNQQSATLKAAEVANSLGYNSGNYQTDARYGFHQRLLDSLQYNIGRQEVISRFSESPVANLYPYYWEIRFDREDADSEGDQEEEIVLGEGPEHLRTNPGELMIRLGPTGKWIELINDRELLPEQPINRRALRDAFESDSTLKLWNSVPDSAWDGILNFDLEQGYDAAVSEGDETSDDRSDQERHHQFTRDELLRLAAYHIKKTGWDLEKFTPSDIRIEIVKGIEVARIQYSAEEMSYGQHVSLQVGITPTGAMLELKAIYDQIGTNNNNFPPLWELTIVGIVFLFGLASIIVFYFRMRARVIDTKSALVVSILAGFIVPVIIFLNEAADINLFEEGTNWLRFLGLALNMGFLGALASVGFFVISAISDSITRQHWPEKLDCYDYLRQGMFFNKPVGEAVVRSVILTFIVAGIWSVLLWFFPNVYMEISDFLNNDVIWPPVYLLLDNFWYSLILVMGIFMVLGSQVYAQTKKKWLAGASMALATGIVLPLPLTLGPAFQQFIIFLILGSILTIIYMKWDFLTLLLTHFLFTTLLVISSGWIVENSPDAYIFISFLVFVLFLATGGTLSIVKGKEEQALPSYVPEYVEELAQEERIKQELQIARDVQQSFLPVNTPAISNLDLAAVCKPAYETGGDYYDFIQLDDHRLAVAIGDVSGKGIQAAFYMTFTKGILHSLCRETESPAELLKKANRLFYDNARRGTFISLIYGIVDIKEKTFRFARAGHNPLLHIRGKNGNIELLQPNGLGLGLTKNSTFDENIQETTLYLDAGDVLVLYTDGIVEALNAAHQFYGTDRLRKLLLHKNEQDATQILSNLVNDVTRFAGQAKQHDDMTVMIIKLDEEKPIEIKN